MAKLALALLVAQTATASFLPARATTVVAPVQNPEALGGGEVLFEVTVDDTGQPRDLRTLRTAAPFTAAVADAIRQWRFSPARETAPGQPDRVVEGTVLVAALFRPPTLYNAAGPSPTTADVGTASRAVPFPTAVVMPPYPPLALFDGVVVIEASVTTKGTVAEARIVDGGVIFSPAAQAAAREWRFRPAERDGLPTASVAYLIFGFRQPVTGRGGPAPR